VYAACVKEADPTRIRVEQTGKLTLGDQGSSSEALRNPRMFVWSAQKNLLFLPATLFTNAHDKDNAYRNKDVFQGLVSLQITPSGIQEKGRITHIDTKGIEEARLKECAQYSTTTKSACVKIIGGGEYCPPASTYVPTYCYADSTTGEYLANMIWNYSTAFIKRSVYIGNNLYTISDSEMRSSAIDNGYKVQSIIPMVPVNNRLGQMNNVIE
jgi:hypothetical protein